MTLNLHSIARRALRTLVVVPALGVAVHAAGAQANLSTQGFGYPTGQFSTRAWGTGGAIAEIDPLTQVNPATMAQHGSRIVTFQIEPEYRTVTGPNGTDHTSTSRYPNVFGAIPVGSQWVVAVGASTLLDRTATTVFNSTQILHPGDSVPMKTQYRVDGAMTDVQLAAAWNARTWLRVGVGAHAITGHNLVDITQSFTDTTQFLPFTSSQIIGFSGGAASAGVQLMSKLFSAGFSVRQGGNLRSAVEDTVLTRAHVPNHYGITLAYTGLTNSAIAIRTAKDTWSRLDGLSPDSVKGVDAWDSSIGADIAGPKIGPRILFLRGGFRTRTLPFQADGHDVKENSFTGGLGTTFANGRVITDFAAIYANRDASIAAKEHAWTLSFGISVRP
jgi:hypothetical protein